MRAINERMNKAATSALAFDAVLFVIDSLKWVEDDELVFAKVQNLGVPVIAVINKSDTIRTKLSYSRYYKNCMTLKYLAISCPYLRYVRITYERASTSHR